jgi:hypothetical protein
MPHTAHAPTGHPEHPAAKRGIRFPHAATLSKQTPPSLQWRCTPALPSRTPRRECVAHRMRGRRPGPAASADRRPTTGGQRVGQALGDSLWRAGVQCSAIALSGQIPGDHPCHPERPAAPGPERKRGGSGGRRGFCFPHAGALNKQIPRPKNGLGMTPRSAGFRNSARRACRAGAARWAHQDDLDRVPRRGRLQPVPRPRDILPHRRNREPRPWPIRFRTSSGRL